MRASDESGQILVVTGIALVLMLCCVGLVVDVGHAMLVQRQLQAGVDAAALAGVQHLPDAPVAESVARQYSATPASKNAVNTVDNAVTTATVSCLAGVPGCNRRDGGVNGITVVSSSRVPTWFGRIIGISTLSVSAKAVACSPCQVKPLDIMIVLDRTGSMCAPISCNPQNQSDLRNAKDGIKTFLGFLEPAIDRVGLALFPPVLDDSWRPWCGSPSGYRPWTGNGNPNTPPNGALNGRYYGYGAYWPRYVADPLGSTPSWYTVASLEGARTDVNPMTGGDNLQNYYVVNVNGTWTINDGAPGSGTNGQSAMIQRLNCAGGNGTTSYAMSVEEAQHELATNGRPNVPDVMIFLSDGAANTMPQNVNTGHWSSDGPNGWVLRPCGAGVEAARRVKAAGTVVYTIGYDLDQGTGAAEKCRQPDPNGQHNPNNPEETGCGIPPSGWGSPAGCTAYDAIQAMATDPDGAGPAPRLFYNKPDPGELNTIFRAIALDLSGSRGRLIDNNSPLLP